MRGKFVPDIKHYEAEVGHSRSADESLMVAV